MFPVTALPKLFSAPVAAFAILFIVIPVVVTAPVHVGLGLFWSVKVIEAVAGATTITPVLFQLAPAASLI